MKKIWFVIAGFLLLNFYTIGQTVKVPLTLERWDTITYKDVDSSLHVKFEPETYLGKECIRLESGGMVMKGVELRDGIIEADISFPQERSFQGFSVRMQNLDNLENFYLRPHQSGNPDATQYTPVFNGQTGFQLYYGPGYDGPFSFRFNEWHHIKIDLHGLQAEFYIDDSLVIKVKELLTGWKAGKIAIGTSSGSTLRVANVKYEIKNLPAPNAIPAPANGQGGLITQWQISNLVHSRLFNKIYSLTPEIKNNLSWSVERTQSSGLLNLARFGGTPSDTGRTIVAKLIVESSSAQIKELLFGFSDNVAVYLNDMVLYYGTDKQYSRDYRFLGTIGYFDKLFLPLKKGRNELWFVVSEDFGGWGVQAKFENMEGISLK